MCGPFRGSNNKPEVLPGFFMSHNYRGVISLANDSGCRREVATTETIDESGGSREQMLGLKMAFFPSSGSCARDRMLQNKSLNHEMPIRVRDETI
ncbi:MAG: hypothetical protein ACK5PB_18895 [Pirellula sp.]|jgi:hypothetical protein